MANYALLSNGKVINHLLAASVADLGEQASIYDVVDVTNVYPQPSVNWTLEGDVWFPPRTLDKTKTDWNGAGFNDPAITVELIQAALEAPKDDSKKSSKKED
jgi:hypothetical protein